MKKAKNRLTSILLLFILSSSSFILYNNVENSASNSLIQDTISPKLSNPGKSLLHSYDFEDETIGQDPTYESFTIDESSGDVYIDDLVDGQQKHLALHKVGSTGRVWVRDNFSRFGETYTAGEYHLKVYHDASGFGINLNSANMEYILAMVWWNGEIRDNVGGTLLATYAYDQWLDVVIYFNLSLGWMFDLEGVRYGAGYSFSFFGPFTANAEHIWITSFVSGGGDGYFRVDDISFYYENENLISIFTPESKKYSKPMDGYYPGTYGFENDKYGEQAQGWWTQNEANCDSQIIDNYKGHNDVYELSDNNPAAKADVVNTFGNKTYGTIELWFLHYATSYYSGISVAYRDPFVSMIWLQILPGDYLYVFNGTTQITLPELGTIQADTWYHLRVDFRIAGAPSYMGLSEDSFILYLNGRKMNEELLLRNTGSTINEIGFFTGYSPAGPDQFYYFDAVGFSWDPNYEVGDNLYEGLLLSFENSTDLDWIGYSLDGQLNKTILGNTTVPMPEDGIHSIQVFGNDSLGDMYHSDLRHFIVDFPIDIITPEAKTYIKGMSGYYPATYGFENDADGVSQPKGFNNFYSPSCSGVVVSEIGGHKKVFRAYDDNGGAAIIKQEFNGAGFQNQTHGTVEYWFRVTSTGVNTEIRLNWGYGTNDATIVFRIEGSTGQWQQNDGTWKVMPNIPNPTPNAWHHIQIHFRCEGSPSHLGLGENQYELIVNGTSSGTLSFATNSTEIALFMPIYTAWGFYGGNYAYCDAIGYSWDPNYYIGDNLYEGLLLSFENRTELNWIGYSLDGQANKTILGNTTIKMPGDGLHAIQLFGNDSLGTMYQSDIRYFTVNITQILDLIAPIITINSPLLNDLLGSAGPFFNITIIEPNLDTMWYTLDGGIFNITTTEPTGNIYQPEWEKIGNGTVTIEFYANDTAGNLGFEDVEMRKDILPPQITINTPIQNQLFDDTAPSFDLTISEGNLDARWYSLDGGATVMQFIGFAGVINQTEWDKIADGTATIIFYANDTLNNLGFSEVSVRKDTVEPQITINSPTQNQVFYDMAPSFDLTIDEGNLDAIWYTLDDGLVTFLCGTSGNINNLYWNAIPPGFYILKFYANDTLGNIGFSEVTIKKEEPAIPGYNPFALSLILFVGIMVISLKRKKKLK